MNAPARQYLDQPGIYRSVSEADYHSDPVVEPSASASVLSLLYSRSPLHAWYAHPRLNDDYVGSPSTRAQAFGTAVHAMLTLSRNVTCCDFDDWRTKDARQEKTEIEEAGGIALLRDDYATAERMLSTLRRGLVGHEVGDVFNQGIGEATIVWRDDGAWIRGRADWWSEKRGLIVDYKTTTTAEPDAWSRKLFDLGSDFAGVLYPQGVAAVTGARPPRFLYVVQEVEPPHAFTVVELDDVAREFTTNRVAQAFRAWRECLAANRWPGYAPSVHHVSPPAYAVKREEGRALAAAAAKELIVDQA
ncbi:MAG: PD-(D/E)XK nuclease-like domain-containing protein [Reyranellaceae bacterium]